MAPYPSAPVPQYNGNANVNAMQSQPQVSSAYVLPVGYYTNPNHAPGTIFPAQEVATPIIKKKEVNWLAVASIIVCLVIGVPAALYFLIAFIVFGAVYSM